MPAIFQIQCHSEGGIRKSEQSLAYIEIVYIGTLNIYVAFFRNACQGSAACVNRGTHHATKENRDYFLSHIFEKNAHSAGTGNKSSI